MAGRPGLYLNIHRKKRRIAAGSGEKMRTKGSKGAPTDKAFRISKRTAKKPKLVSLVSSFQGHETKAG